MQVLPQPHSLFFLQCHPHRLKAMTLNQWYRNFLPSVGASFSLKLLYLLFLLFSVSLDRPSISVTSPNGGLVKVPEGAEIIKGYSFIFTCTTNVHYTGAVFFLIFSRSNMKYNMTSVNNSASLSFPVADLEHDADYSCVYEITLSSRKITAQESQWIHAFVICK